MCLFATLSSDFFSPDMMIYYDSTTNYFKYIEIGFDRRYPENVFGLI